MLDLAFTLFNCQPLSISQPHAFNNFCCFKYCRCILFTTLQYVGWVVNNHQDISCNLADGWFTEVLGVNFAFLYGPYHYADLLSGPLVLGVPPMAMLIYFPLGYACFIMGRAIVGGLSTKVTEVRLLGVAIFAGLAMTTHDFSNDPFMSTVKGIWVWPNGGAYFGVPLQNFIGWFVLTSFFSIILGLIVNSAKAMSYVSIPKTPTFFLPAILLYLIFELPQILRPILLEPTPINLSGSGIAMFATTIPVMAALLALYGQHTQKKASIDRSI
jgi:uncharacterized membrane protein